MLLKRTFQSQGNNYCGKIMASKNKKKINILVSNYNNKTKEEIVQVNIYKYMYIYYISYYINILLYIYIYIYIKYIQAL